jgi:hypothetical protein
MKIFKDKKENNESTQLRFLMFLANQEEYILRNLNKLR